mmetsp:Transcript_37772/g.93773  ORF Transcript_37772/g.93773 Transcript_37772/m.93773 type:complete len:316 (+) Transcript_37772:253-1200(+)
MTNRRVLCSARREPCRASTSSTSGTRTRRAATSTSMSERVNVDDPGSSASHRRTRSALSPARTASKRMVSWPSLKSGDTVSVTCAPTTTLPTTHGTVCSTGARGVCSKVWPRPGPARSPPGGGPRRPSLKLNVVGAELRRARCAAGAETTAVFRFGSSATCGVCTYSSKNSARLSSTASLVAAMSSLASDVHPDAFPVSCLSTRATTSQHCEGCFAGRWIGSGCADKTRRPGWSTGAAPSVREPSSMDPKRRSSEAKADAHHIDGYNAISRWTSLCILKVELLKIARCLTFSFACWSTRGALALGPYHRMLVARP